MPHYHVICSRPEAGDFLLEADAADPTALAAQIAKSRPGCTIVSAIDLETHAKVLPAEEAEGRRVVAEKAAADAKAKAEADAKAAAVKAHPPVAPPAPPRPVAPVVPAPPVVPEA